MAKNTVLIEAWQGEEYHRIELKNHSIAEVLEFNKFIAQHYPLISIQAGSDIKIDVLSYDIFRFLENGYSCSPIGIIPNLRICELTLESEDKE